MASLIEKARNSPAAKTIFLLSYAGFAVIGNLSEQLFCQPVSWATILMCVVFPPVIFYPFFSNEHGWYKELSWLAHGICLMCCLYMIIFLGELNYLGIPLCIVGIGLLGYVPHVFVATIIYRLVRVWETGASTMFFAGILTCLLFAGWCGFSYGNACVEINDKINGDGQIEEVFMAEKIVGMHFKYHTSLCYFDGWRPPLHDPAMVLGYWLNGKKDPLRVNLRERVLLYRKLFPNEESHPDCQCAPFGYSSNYRTDALFAP